MISCRHTVILYTKSSARFTSQAITVNRKVHLQVRSRIINILEGIAVNYTSFSMNKFAPSNFENV